MCFSACSASHRLFPLSSLPLPPGCRLPQAGRRLHSGSSWPVRSLPAVCGLQPLPALLAGSGHHSPSLPPKGPEGARIIGTFSTPRLKSRSGPVGPPRTLSGWVLVPDFLLLTVAWVSDHFIVLKSPKQKPVPFETFRWPHGTPGWCFHAAVQLSARACPPAGLKPLRGFFFCVPTPSAPRGQQADLEGDQESWGRRRAGPCWRQTKEGCQIQTQRETKE